MCSKITSFELTIVLSAICCFQIILSRQYGSEGRFTFTSHTPGEHQICLHSNSTKMALFAGGKLVKDILMDNHVHFCDH